MNAADAQDIGKRFLVELDKYLKTNWQDLRCKSLHEIYFGFFEDLKRFTGNSSGFTGLSEFLIFRFLYHFLGGPSRFAREKGRFVSKLRDDLWIARSAPLPIEGRNMRPDIAVLQGSELMAAAQIKVYLTEGQKTVKTEFDTLRRLKEEYSEMAALLVIYTGWKRKEGKVESVLKELTNSHQWFDYLTLQYDDRPFALALHKQLGLGRIAVGR